MDFGPQTDTIGNPIAWINPQHFAEFVAQVRRRGLTPAEIGFLNTPAPHWYRKVRLSPAGAEVQWGWKAS